MRTLSYNKVLDKVFLIPDALPSLTLREQSHVKRLF